MSDHDEWISYSHWGMFTPEANPRGSRIDLARQFALRLQLSANTHDMRSGLCALRSGLH